VAQEESAAMSAAMSAVAPPALIFDFDGLLVDTESTVLEAWQQQFALHGVGFPLKVWHRYIGSMGSQQAMMAALRESGVVFDDAQFLAQWRERHAELVRLVFLREGVQAFLDEAAALGAKLAVASSATREWLDEQLARVGIRDRFEVVCARDNGKVKPAPDIYLAALEALGIDAADAIAFEDSPNGIAGAKAAGLYCIAVPNPVTAGLALDGADMQVHTFRELTVAGVTTLLRSR
jgi:HAD superfamily hydrolase (TIGR01509 family)